MCSLVQLYCKTGLISVRFNKGHPLVLMITLNQWKALK